MLKYFFLCLFSLVQIQGFTEDWETEQDPFESIAPCCVLHEIAKAHMQIGSDSTMHILNLKWDASWTSICNVIINISTYIIILTKHHKITNIVVHVCLSLFIVFQ